MNPTRLPGVGAPNVPPASTEPKVAPKTATVEAPRTAPVEAPKAKPLEGGAEPGVLTPDITSGEAVAAISGRKSEPATSPLNSRVARMADASADPRKIIGLAVAREAKEAARAKLYEKSPENAAAVDAMGGEVAKLAEATALEVLKDPAALQKLDAVVAKLGKEGFSEALKASGPELAKAFTNATGLRAVNTEAAEAVLSRLPGLAEKVAPSQAAKVAKAVEGVASKLGVEVLKSTAEGATKTVAKEVAEAATKTVAKEVAEAAAKTVAKEGAEAAAKGGAKLAAKGTATAGKAVPGLGNVIAVGSAVIAGAGLVRELFRRPAEGERIAKEGVNTLLQTAGIFFPWVALGGDVVDLGWSVKLAAKDAKAGKAPEGQGEALRLLEASSDTMTQAFKDAGHGGGEGAFAALSEASRRAASEPSQRSKRELLTAARSAFEVFTTTAGGELHKVADGLPDSPDRVSIRASAEGFDRLKKSIDKADKLPTGGDRQPVVDGVLGAVGKAAIATVANG